MLGVDILLYWLATKIWPDKPKQTYSQSNYNDAEDSANWIILDDMNRQIGEEDWSNNTDRQSSEAPNDPPMDYDGDYFGGEW